MSSNEVVLTKPKSMWNRPLKFDVKSLFVALGKAATHAATLKVEDLGNDAVEAVVSLGLVVTPQEVTFYLIKKSLFDALLKLTKESIMHVGVGVGEIEALSSELDAKLSGLTIRLDEEFFKNPAKADFIKGIVSAYSQWLRDCGATKLDAEVIAQRFPSYFVFSISSEWRKDSSRYQVLLDDIDSPFALAERHERGWRLYFSFLRLRVSESVFDETFGLAQIYVPLNAFYVEKLKRIDSLSPLAGVNERRICVDLRDELISWLRVNDKSDALRVVSGGPGSGKSSFTKIFCCELAEQGLAKPIYIPLHLIDPTRDVSSEVERYVRDEGLIGFNPLDPERGEDGLLLVFDGLDELASMGKVAAQVARDFVQAVEKMIERRNLGAHPIFVLLSGRELIVQENETEFRKPKQVLTILPYYVSGAHAGYVDANKVLEKDLRNEWWANYGALTGKAFSGIPENLKVREIDEITSQPLLNYLVALSYGRGKLDFTRSINLNSVYADLVAAVHERAYEKTRTFRPISHISYRDFVRVLEEVGLAAWHGSDGRSTSVKEIMQHCHESGLEALLKTFTEGAEAGVTKLLAAFFFRRNGEAVGEDAAFVFTHKSFGEYLTAARLVRGLERIVSERVRRRDNMDEGFDVVEALVFWLKIAGPAPMTEYLKNFVQREISRRPDEVLSLWQDVLSELATVAIDRMMPVERLGGMAFSSAVRYDINASVALIISLNSCSLAIRRVAKIKFSSVTSFGTFLRRMCPQRSGPQSPLLYTSLSYFDYSMQCLDLADLYRANLEYSNFTGCKAHYANFGMADLTGANCSEAIFSYGFIENAFIGDAIFYGAKFEKMKMPKDLEGIDFSASHFTDVDFDKGEIKNCNFEGAKFSRAQIYKSVLIENCSFDGALVTRSDTKFIKWFDANKKNGGVSGGLSLVASERDLIRNKRLAKRDV